MKFNTKAIPELNIPTLGISDESGKSLLAKLTTVFDAVRQVGGVAFGVQNSKGAVTVVRVNIDGAAPFFEACINGEWVRMG